MTKNSLIVSRPGVGKTQKAIDIYIEKITSNINGVYFTLEMHDTELMQRVLSSASEKDISLSKSAIKNLYITDSCFSFEEIINYIQKIEDNINFAIIDYIQLVNRKDAADFNIQINTFFDYCKSKNIDVILLSQLKKGFENKGSIWTEAILELAVSGNYFLKYIDDGYLITQSYGEIYSEDMKKINNLKTSNKC